MNVLQHRPGVHLMDIHNVRTLAQGTTKTSTRHHQQKTTAVALLPQELPSTSARTTTTHLLVDEVPKDIDVAVSTRVCRKYVVVRNDHHAFRIPNLRWKGDDHVQMGACTRHLQPMQHENPGCISEATLLGFAPNSSATQYFVQLTHKQHRAVMRNPRADT